MRWFKRTYPIKHLKKILYWRLAEYRILRDARAVLFTCEEERRLARLSFHPYSCRERVVNYGTAGRPENFQEHKTGFFIGSDPAAKTDARVVEVEIRLDDGTAVRGLTNLQVEVEFEP